VRKQQRHGEERAVVRALAAFTVTACADFEKEGAGGAVLFRAVDARQVASAAAA